MSAWASRRARRSLSPDRADRAARIACPGSLRARSLGSSQPGGSMRSTSAPNPARNRVAIGPARMRVMSSTRTPASGRAGSTTHTGEWAPLVRLQRSSGSRRDRRALRMRGPSRQRSHRRGAAAARDDRRFEFVRPPALRRGAHGLLSAGGSQHGQRGRRDDAPRWCAAESSRRRRHSRPRWRPRPAATTSRSA